MKNVNNYKGGINTYYGLLFKKSNNFSHDSQLYCSITGDSINVALKGRILVLA